MNNTAKRWMRSCLSMLLILSLMLSLSTVALAAEFGKTASGIRDINGDGKINYVSMGASNTNGYGLRGYITEDEINGIVSGQISKADVNVYGYHRCPEGSYPDLVADYIRAQNPNTTVNHEQLAMSSMRVEEVRVLLDNDYYGDAYTRWRFIKDDGTGWFNIAEPAGLEALRSSYQTAVANADLITLDIGWNNFGVYVCNRLTSYLKTGVGSYEADLTKVLGEGSEEVAQQVVDMIRDVVEDTIGSYADLSAISDKDLDFVCETFAYSLVGYIVNFDVVMGKIYEANPDVQVVVLGIQNLLYDTNIEIDGSTLPLGLIYGQIVDMANVYLSEKSPYSDKYTFTMTGDSQNHVTTFLDEMALYDGNPETLNENIKDCFDIYDEDLMIRFKLQYMLGEMYKAELAALGMTAAEFVAAGEAGTLPEAAVPYYNTYVAALNEAYDTMADIMQYLAKIDTLDLAGMSGLDGDVEDALGDYIANCFVECVQAVLAGEEYEPDFSIFDDPAYTLVGVINVRFYVGNSFFAHPSNDGHVEIYEDVIKAATSTSFNFLFLLPQLETLLDDIVDAISCENTSHICSDAAWTWAEDYSTAAVSQTCYKCATSVSGEKAVISSETKNASCTEAGKITYTAKASLYGKEVTDTKEVSIPAPGHSYEITWAWAKDYSTASASFNCTACESDPETVTAAVTSKKEEATCTADGKTVYTAAAAFDGKEYTSTKEVVIPAPGHSYVDGVCSVCGHDTTTPDAASVYRVYGDSRYDTAFAITDTLKTALNTEMFDTIILASGTNFADALAGSYLASVKCAPILITDGTNAEAVKDYIKENLSDGGMVYILGGIAAVSQDVEDVLEKAGIEVDRLYGDTRYLTNLEILKEAGISDDQEILICSGTSFSDALSASATGYPIMLVGAELTDEQAAFLEKTSGKFAIIGGTAAVSPEVETALEKIGDTERVYGDTRYLTSVAVADRFFNSPKTAILAYGGNFPDGLCGGPLAYAAKAPLILTMEGKESDAAAYCAKNGIVNGAALGGTAVLTDNSIRTVFAMDEKAEITAYKYESLVK